MDCLKMSKKELVVLFRLFINSDMPIGITDMPHLDVYEQDRIIDLLIQSNMIGVAEGAFVSNQILEKFLLPIAQCRDIFIYHFGEENNNTFNSSIFITENSILSVLEITPDLVELVPITSGTALIELHLPFFNANTDVSQFIHYTIFNDDTSTYHRATISNTEKTIYVCERKEWRCGKEVKQDAHMDILEYQALLKDKIMEMCHVISD